MKSITKLLVLMMFVSLQMNSQTNVIENVKNENYFQISTRVGYDIVPMYDNDTPYIDYKGGLELGASLDYYWSWIGLGLDFDYIKNKPESTYPTNFPTTISTNWNLSEDAITRTFIGIGPSFKYQTVSNKFTLELNTRVGISNIKGGRTELSYLATPVNFHAGYDAKNVLSGKAQLRATYFFNENWGVNAGVYYLRHFGVTELSENIMGSNISALYYPFTMVDDPTGVSGKVPELVGGDPLSREKPCDCDISSIGVFAGITYKFSKKEKKTEDCQVCEGCGITVTAKDKLSGQLLPNTDVVLVDDEGNITQTGRTNNYGVVVFKDVAPNNYTIKGKLYDIDLEENLVTKSELKKCLKAENKNIQKEILYTDVNFVLKGNVVECNTSNGLQGVDVILRSKETSSQKNTKSDAKGDFIFHVNQATIYALRGFKDGYFSNSVEVDTKQYNRNASLFIDFEMCVDPCGEAIRLDNINFDLAKWDILDKSIPDLQKIVQLMQDNPDIKVEMSSHTDSRGNNAYNLDLSQKRAQATVDYVVSQGISRDRLVARGAGETELLNRCADNVQCLEDEHAINRRTEFRVICVE